MLYFGIGLLNMVVMRRWLDLIKDLYSIWLTLSTIGNCFDEITPGYRSSML